MLGITSKADLEALVATWNDRKTYIPKWGYHHEINPVELLNFDDLESRD